MTQEEYKELAKKLGLGAAGTAGVWTAAGATPRMLQRTGLSGSLQDKILKPQYQSTKIKDFYSAGANKMKLAFEHMGVFSPSDEVRQVERLLERALGDHKISTGSVNATTKSGRYLSQTKNLIHGHGEHAIKLVEEFDRDVRSWSPKELKARFNNPEYKKQFLNAIRSKRLSFQTPAQANAMIDELILSDKNLNPAYNRVKSLKSTQMHIRHEKAAQELVRHSLGKKNVDYDRLNRAGITKPVKTTVGKIFERHVGAMQAWKDADGLLPEHNITHSSVNRAVGADHVKLIGSATKDAKYKLAHHVMKSGIDINNPKEVQKLLKEFSYSFSQKGSFSAPFKLHPQDPHIDDIVKWFTRNYAVNGNELRINFSPQYKPHYLLGGVNADVILTKGPRGGITREILVSDLYDLTQAPAQQRHITTAHSTQKQSNLGKSSNQLYQDSLKPFKQNLSKKEIVTNQLKRAGRRLGKNNPLYQVSKVGGKYGKAALAIGALATTVAPMLFDDEENLIDTFASSE